MTIEADKMSEDKAQAGQQEPSMEDILASIRRILSEDGDERPETETGSTEDRKGFDDPAQPAATDAAGGAPSGPEKAVVEVDETPAQVTEGDPFEDAEPRADREVAVAGGEDRSEGPDLLSDDAPARDPEIEFADILELTPDMRVGPVVSSPTAVASTDVLAQLAKAILNRRDMAVGARDVTLESMVREMLRPLLKEWLDRNLPYLIERLVKKEIDLMINRAERLEE